MRRLLFTFVFLVAIGEAALIAAFIQRSQVSTFEIDRDRATISAQISEAESESAKFEGGAIKVMIEMRIAVLKNTTAMLDQKRASLVRLVALNYTVDGSTLHEANDKELNDILEELAASERSVADAKQEAAKYTGGLVQVMALVKAATEEVTASSLRLKFYAAKYGIPIHIPSVEATKAPAPKSPGTVVKDREAL
jgi:hypothetical protein